MTAGVHLVENSDQIHMGPCSLALPQRSSKSTAKCYCTVPVAIFQGHLRFSNERPHKKKTKMA
jgi:hypothetical protein